MFSKTSFWLILTIVLVLDSIYFPVIGNIFYFFGLATIGSIWDFANFFLLIISAVIFLVVGLSNFVKKQEDKKFAAEPFFENPLENARNLIRLYWTMIENLAGGDDELISKYYMPETVERSRKHILESGEEIAFLYMLSQDKFAIPQKYHGLMRGRYFDGPTQFKKAFFLFLQEPFNEALSLETKTGDWSIRSNEHQYKDNSSVLLGFDKNNDEVWHSGEGHLITIAPTGAGKGQCHVLPNLYNYNGPVFVLDIKGENELYTGLHRGRYGNSFTFAPYSEESDHYNPLDFVETWSDCREMADWLMVPSGGTGRDDYFHNRGKELLAAVIYYLIKDFEPHQKNMRKVCSLLWSGTDEFKIMWESMSKIKDEIIVESALDMQSTFKNSPKEFSGTINAAKQCMEIWREPEVVAVTSDTEDGWHPADLRNSPAGKESIVKNGPTEKMSEQKIDELKEKLGMSIFLNVPVGKVKQMASVLRVFIGQHIREIIKASDDPKMGYDHGGTKAGLPTAPVMFMLDEFPQLGFMKVIEETLEVGRSYKIRLWLFAQDMGQLGRHYPNPKGIMANCNVQSFMNLNDNETAKYVSERLGTVRPIIGNNRPLADLPELMGEEFKDNFVCLMRNTKPLKLAKAYSYNTSPFKEYMAKVRERKGVAE